MNNKKEPKFRFLESLDEYKSEVPKIKAEWESIKSKENKPFSGFTDSKIQELELLLNSDLENNIKIHKAFSIITMLDNTHFIRDLDLDDVFLETQSADKLRVFIKYSNQLNDKEYWMKLSALYSEQDYEPVPYEILFSLFNSSRSHKECLMDNSEKQFFDNLPEEIIIFRAMSESEFNSGKYRFSWTIDEKVAKKFKERSSLLYDEKMIVHSMKVKKKNILAYLNRREEKEIIYVQQNGYTV